LARQQPDLGCLRIYSVDECHGAQLDFSRAVEVGVMDGGGGGEICLTSQVRLCERRPLVREDGLLAKKHDPTVEALVTERLRGRGSGLAAADDHKSLR
jgi:hypothetical protein